MRPLRNCFYRPLFFSLCIDRTSLILCVSQFFIEARHCRQYNVATLDVEFPLSSESVAVAVTVAAVCLVTFLD